MESIAVGNESPPARQSILGSFLRGRPRGVSQSHPSPPHDAPQPARDSPPPGTSSAAQDVPGHRRRPAAVQPSLSQSFQPSSSLAGSSPFQMLRRRRSASALASNATPQVPAAVAVARTAVPTTTTTAAATNTNNTTSAPNVNASASPAANGPSHRIRLVPHVDSRRSLRFDPICRDVREGESPLRIGRFTDRSGLGIAAANALGSNKLAFKSKVVSRAHAEIWVEAGGRFFIKDTKSSSGTFLNHVRLSPANQESRPSELKDGDLLQLGVDYQGGTEDIYKCVKIRVEVGREWQSHTNPFNSNALNQLKAIATPIQPSTTTIKKVPVSAKSSLPDCCICLFCVTIHQALFIAPCSHAFHFKCIRPLLETHHPSFNCPLCRTYANLDEDVEVEIELEEEGVEDAGVGVGGLASLATPVIPELGRERERERERERDAGAETEVEPDGGGARLGMSLRRRAAPQPDVVDMSEDVEMEDAYPLPALPEDDMDDDDDDDVAIETESASGSGSAVRDASPASRHGHGRGGRDDYMFDAEGVGVGEAGGSGEVGELGVVSEVGAGEIVNGKRKR